MSKTLETSTISIVTSNPIQVLHVDDDQAFLSMAKQCLELKNDVQVESTNSVQEAFEKLKTKTYDVIVSDYQMADKDGLEFLRELDASGNKIPFILFTGKGRNEVAVKALNLGAFRYVSKNGAPDAVYAELASCIRQARDYSRSQEMLRQSEKRFRAVFDSSIDAIIVVNDSGNIVYSNKAADTMLDYNQDAIIHALKEHFLQQFTVAYEQNMKGGFTIMDNDKFAMTGKTLELTIQKTPSEKKNVELSFSAFLENGQWHGVSIIRDITERRKQECMLSESQQKLKALFSQNPGAIAFLDKSFRVVDINSSFTALFGYKLEEIKDEIISDIIVPKGFEEETEIISEKIQEGPIGCSTMRKRNDDSIFNAALSAGPLVVDGEVTGFFMVFMDISDFVIVQEQLSKSLEKEQLLNEKVLVLGGFTRHDVRNKLGLIQGNLYLARQKANINPELEKYFKSIEEVIKNITDIFNFAKTYEMVGSEELVMTDIGAMFQNALSLFSDLEGVKVLNHCNGLKTLADSLLTQVFHNLIDNSLKYGTEKISEIKIYSEKNSEGALKLIYEDDGPGIDAETKEHLFQKGFGKGTGLGLYLIRKICEVYGWTVQEKGQLGVKFEFIIPKENLQQHKKLG